MYLPPQECTISLKLLGRTTESSNFSSHFLSVAFLLHICHLRDPPWMLGSPCATPSASMPLPITSSKRPESAIFQWSLHLTSLISHPLNIPLQSYRLSCSSFSPLDMLLPQDLCTTPPAQNFSSLVAARIKNSYNKWLPGVAQILRRGLLTSHIKSHPWSPGLLLHLLACVFFQDSSTTDTSVNCLQPHLVASVHIFPMKHEPWKMLSFTSVSSCSPHLSHGEDTVRASSTLGALGSILVQEQDPCTN